MITLLQMFPKIDASIKSICLDVFRADGNFNLNQQQNNDLFVAPSHVFNTATSMGEINLLFIGSKLSFFTPTLRAAGEQQKKVTDIDDWY